MDPLTISLIAGLGNAAIKGGTALMQNRRAKALEQESRPEYKIPTAISEATGTARMAYNDPSMYAATLAQRNIQQNGAQSLRAIRESGGGSNAVIAGAGAINSGMNNASRQIAIDTERQRERDLQTLLRVLGNKAGYEDKAYSLNQLDPYLDQQQAAQDLRYAARGNTDSLMGDMSNLGTNLALGAMYDDMMQQPQARQGIQPISPSPGNSVLTNPIATPTTIPQPQIPLVPTNPYPVPHNQAWPQGPSPLNVYSAPPQADPLPLRQAWMKALNISF